MINSSDGPMSAMHMQSAVFAISIYPSLTLYRLTTYFDLFFFFLETAGKCSERYSVS